SGGGRSRAQLGVGRFAVGHIVFNGQVGDLVWTQRLIVLNKRDAIKVAGGVVDRHPLGQAADRDAQGRECEFGGIGDLHRLYQESALRVQLRSTSGHWKTVD